jgi:hypothetical protein
MLLRSLNIPNLEEVMKDIENKRTDIDAKNALDQQNKLAIATAVGSSPEVANKLSESYHEVAEAVNRLVAANAD